ncbi:hypothetical protein G9A89_002897 [Geosiphon pyriformis]|nr:hypothetical protein G9A89_002897 [Geosiphon pyriformis]
MSSNLSGRVVLITGASSGIGAAAALEFAKHGRGKCLIELRDNIISQYPSVQVHHSVVDIRNKDEVDQAVANLPENFKDVDVLVNNAGIAIGFDPLEESKHQNVIAVLETNINGAIYMIQAILPSMKARNSGDIINIGSISGQQTHQYGNAIYSGSKFALEGITLSIRKELVATKIRVILIRPGAVKTDFTSLRAGGKPDFDDIFYAGYDPLVAKDVADCIIFAAARPNNVVISELTVLPNAQADMTLIHREGNVGPIPAKDKPRYP